MKPWLVNVPVLISIWIRPDCQRRQFEIIKEARPSILFLQSDGGRNAEEWDAINRNRKMFDEEIDWDCTVYKLYEESNQGLYTMSRKTNNFIWNTTDRCIFLEDDYLPSVSFFRFCYELLERYKDDKRIEMICGNNVLETYRDAEPNDYFFTENGWSIWGVATWRDRGIDREFPFGYRDDRYIKDCLKDNLNRFWYKKVVGYCNNEFYENHRPGDEYYHAINSVLNHRMSIVPTRNMISNIGYNGAHANVNKKKKNTIFGLKTFEISENIHHPIYVINDVRFGKLYDKRLLHDYSAITTIKKIIIHLERYFKHLRKGTLFSFSKSKNTIEH